MDDRYTIAKLRKEHRWVIVAKKFKAGYDDESCTQLLVRERRSFFILPLGEFLEVKHATLDEFLTCDDEEIREIGREIHGYKFSPELDEWSVFEWKTWDPIEEKTIKVLVVHLYHVSVNERGEPILWGNDYHSIALVPTAKYLTLCEVPLEETKFKERGTIEFLLTHKNSRIRKIAVAFNKQFVERIPCK